MANDDEVAVLMADSRSAMYKATPRTPRPRRCALTSPPGAPRKNDPTRDIPAMPWDIPAMPYRVSRTEVWSCRFALVGGEEVTVHAQDRVSRKEVWSCRFALLGGEEVTVHAQDAMSSP